MSEAADDVPAKFYKYRSMSGEAREHVERTILHDEIYFASAASFNDPFDLRPVISLHASPDQQREDFLRLSRKFQPQLTEVQHEAEADRVMATSMKTDEVENTAAAIQALHTHFIRTAVGVFCVSTKPDHILMWSHYADSHMGICLEFDGASPLMAQAQKVNYSRDRVPINPYEDNHELMADKTLLTKAEHWSYESEWRLIRYRDGPGVCKFRPQDLTGIVIGALASAATVATVRSWVRDRIPPVTLSRVFASGKRFELRIRRD